MSAGSSASWRGYFAATVTPFNRDLTIDEAGFRALLTWLIDEGMHGIAVAGTTGEWPALERAERVRLFELARETVPAHLPLIAGCSAISLAETLRLIDASGALGLSGVLLTIPPYIHPTDEEIVYFYAEAARHSRLPIIVYNWPLGTGKELSLEVLSRLAAIENIVALKNSTTNTRSFVESLCALKDRLRVFGVMPGDAGLALLREFGGDGCIGASGALGRAQPGFFEAAWRGDFAEAAVLGRLDQTVMTELFTGFVGRHGHAIATIKALLRARGLPAGPVRPPLLDLGEAGLAHVTALARRLGLVDGG